MKTRLGFKVCLLAFAACLAAGRVSEAQLVVAQHSGGNDPTTEGWTALSSGSPSGSPVNDGGTNAWNIVAPNGSSLYYSINPLTLTPTQSSHINSAGWHVSWTLNILTTNVGGSDLKVFMDLALGSLVPGGYEYFMGIGTKKETTTYDLRFLLKDQTGDVVFPLVGQGAGYHTYDLYGTPNNGTAKLYVDGNFITNFNGKTDTNQRLRWGSFGTSGPVEEHWAQFYFEVPEPSTVGLLGLSGLCLLPFWRRRTRRV